MTWPEFALLATVLWGLWGFLSKVATLQLPPTAVYLFSLVGYVAVAAHLAVTEGLAISWHPGGLVAALGAGFCLARGLLCFFKALAQGPPVGVVVPLTALYPLITVTLSWALLREGFSLRQLGGVALALPAVWLLASGE